MGAAALTASRVTRLLRAYWLSQRPRATPGARRTFTVELPGDLWMGDAMHGPPAMGADGVVRKKAYLLTKIDVASRYVASSLATICADLGIYRLQVGPGDGAAKAERRMRRHTGRPLLRIEGRSLFPLMHW